MLWSILLGSNSPPPILDRMRLVECRWFYKSGLSPEEAIMTKCFDTELDGRAFRVPHMVFNILGTGDEGEGDCRGEVLISRG